MDVYTFDQPKMDLVLERSMCPKHRAKIGDPCWGIITDEGLGLGAVCNNRAKKAGFVGRISPSSLSTKSGQRRYKNS